MASSGLTITQQWCVGILDPVTSLEVGSFRCIETILVIIMK